MGKKRDQLFWKISWYYVWYIFAKVFVFFFEYYPKFQSVPFAFYTLWLIVPIEEQLSRGRELTKKMQSIDSEDDSEGNEDFGAIENGNEPFVDVEDGIKNDIHSLCSTLGNC